MTSTAPRGRTWTCACACRSPLLPFPPSWRRSSLALLRIVLSESTTEQGGGERARQGPAVDRSRELSSRSLEVEIRQVCSGGVPEETVWTVRDGGAERRTMRDRSTTFPCVVRRRERRIRATVETKHAKCGFILRAFDADGHGSITVGEGWNRVPPPLDAGSPLVARELPRWSRFRRPPLA